MITLIIAIVGAITGILAIILQYIEYRKSKVKLKVNLVENKSFYSTGNTSGDTNYKCKYFGVISIKISNCSALPITIDEAEIKYNEILRPYFSKEKAVNKTHKYDKQSYTEVVLFEQAKLPYRIDCYDTTFLSFIFPFFDEFINNKFEFILKTPRKQYKYKFKLSNFEEMFKKSRR